MGVRARAEIVYNSPPRTLAGWKFGLSLECPPRIRNSGWSIRGILLKGCYILETAEAVSRSDGMEMIIAGFGPKEFVDKAIAKASGYGNVSYIG